MKVRNEMNQKSKRKEVPDMSINECIHKLRRQRDKLKKQLENHTFEPDLYETNKLRNTITSREKSKRKTTMDGDLTARKVTIIRDPIKELKFMV